MTAEDFDQAVDLSARSRTIWRAVAWPTMVATAALGWYLYGWWAAIYWPLLASALLAVVLAPPAFHDVLSRLDAFRDGRPIALRTLLTGPAPVLKAADTIHCVLRLENGRLTMLTRGGRTVVDAPAGDVQFEQAPSRAIRIDQQDSGFVTIVLGSSAFGPTRATPFGGGSRRQIVATLEQIRAAHARQAQPRQD